MILCLRCPENGTTIHDDVTKINEMKYRFEATSSSGATIVDQDSVVMI